jgi:hypothetical protein
MTRSTIAGLLTAVVLLASAAHAGTIYVDDDNCPGPGSGTWYDPYCSIQTAIDNAMDADAIEVAPGTYFEAINLLGKAVWLRSSDGAEVTTIDGTGFFHVVQCVSGEGLNTILDGFTITGGNANGSTPNSRGGGMFNSESSPTVANCMFSGNAARWGGGMYNSRCSPTVTGCTFSDDLAKDVGGGMANLFSNPTVTDCAFSGNTAYHEGGGMGNYLSSPTVADCTFGDNRANNGGGMANRGRSDPTVTNCTFSGNSADDGYGGGMYNDNSSPTVVSCTFSGNAGGGGGMSNDGSSPTVTDCTFTDNSTEFVGGGMYNGGYYSGSNPTVTDCKFMDNWAEDGGGGMYNGGYYSGSSPTVYDCRFERNTAEYGNGGGMLNEDSNPTITDSFFCENTPEHIWGDWDGDDNTFRMFCLPFAFDGPGDVGTGDVLIPASR